MTGIDLKTSILELKIRQLLSKIMLPNFKSDFFLPTTFIIPDTFSSIALGYKCQQSFDLILLPKGGPVQKSNLIEFFDCSILQLLFQNKVKAVKNENKHLNLFFF